MRDRGAVGPDEPKVLPFALELKIGMQLRRIAAVLAGSKHHQVVARGKRHRRELPLRQVRGFVGPVPAIEVHLTLGGVVDFDPIRIVPVRVLERRIVDRHELTDQQRAERQKLPRLQWFQAQPFKVCRGTLRHGRPAPRQYGVRNGSLDVAQHNILP